MHPTIAAKVELAVQQMQRELQTQGVMDVFKWWYFVSTDLIGQLSFGHSFQLLEKGEVCALSLVEMHTFSSFHLKLTALENSNGPRPRVPSSSRDDRHCIPIADPSRTSFAASLLSQRYERRSQDWTVRR